MSGPNMCNKRRLLRRRQVIRCTGILTLAFLTFKALCWIFTFLDPQLLASHLKIYTSYKNSEALIASLKSKVQIFNETEDFSLVKDAEDLKIRNEGYSKYGFNALASRNVGIYRELPDTRHKLCDSISYPNTLPSTSIIICFYNEHFETLLRTLHTIVRNTPANLLHEIILVDDFSDIESLHDLVRKYLSTSTELKHVVHFHKTKRREGLIRARIFGANLASGEVLVFLDSHVEVNKKWLEPMLARIAQDPFNHVVTPIIDIINPNSLQYSSSPFVRGGFNWGLHFKWESIPKSLLTSDEDFVKPVKSPTMAGGLFAMNREYFNKLGQYDSQMDIWGGENLELSFRVWMCGGTLEIIPCSRIGHIFRRQRPYSDGENTMTKNSLRVAHVWLDNYKHNYLSAVPEAKYVHYGDISERVELKNRLNCKSFDWYLQNIYPELILPDDDEKKLEEKSNKFDRPVYQRWDERKRNYVDRFQIRLSNTNLCVTSEKDVRAKGSLLILKTCIRAKNQIWYKTDKNELVLAQLLCLDAGTASDKPKLTKCHELGESQEWHFNKQKNTPIYDSASGTCLGVTYPQVNAYVNMKLCSESVGTRWNLIFDTK